MRTPTNGWVCYACRRYASDTIKIVNQKTSDYIFMHPCCITTAISVMKAPVRREIKQQAKGKAAGRTMLGSAA